MDRSERELILAFCRIRDPDAMRKLFAEIFTLSERRTLSLRWRIVELLAAGMAQREIAAKLGVSLCNITRGARVLRGRDSVMRACVAEGARRRSEPIGRDARRRPPEREKT